MKKGLSTGVKSVIVLTVICLVVAGLLAVTNYITSPIIEKTRQNKIAESLSAVLPDSGNYSEVDLNGAEYPSTVKSIYKFDDGSYAVVLATTSAYSSGDMGFTVGIDPSGRIAGIKLTSYMESKDFGKETYPQSFVDKDFEAAASIDTVSGVTYSSTAFKKALADAFTAVELARQGGAA